MNIKKNVKGTVTRDFRPQVVLFKILYWALYSVLVVNGYANSVYAIVENFILNVVLLFHFFKSKIMDDFANTVYCPLSQ